VWQSKQTSENADQLIEDGTTKILFKRGNQVNHRFLFFQHTKVKWILDHG